MDPKRKADDVKHAATGSRSHLRAESMQAQAGINAEPAVLALLRAEEAARQATDVIALRHMMVSEIRKLTQSRQVFIAETSAHIGLKLTAISSVGAVDAQTALVDAFEKLLRTVLKERGSAEALEFTLPAFVTDDEPLLQAYPYRHMLLLPMKDRAGNCFALLLLAHERPWSSGDDIVATRLVATFAHAWCALSPPSRRRAHPSLRAHWRWLVALVVTLVLALPVPMTALAPVEITASKPQIVAAPMDAVIEEVVVDPSAEVAADAVLLRFVDTNLRNRAEIAQREMQVAEARVRQLSLLSFTEQRGRHEIGLARTELELKRAELSYAKEVLGKTEFRAPVKGIAVFADKKSLVGKPVSTGERIMEIADPKRIEVRIDVPVADAAVLKAASAVKIFLDIDPLRPLSAVVQRFDYRARPSDTDVLAFRAFAELAPVDGEPPRLGLRGVAQVYGEKTYLGFYLFRRPISALRQWLGV